MIPYGRQEIIQDDIDAVINVLRSDFLTQGPKVPAFENLLANLFNVNYAVAVNSATSALHVACLALDVGPGDTVWTSPNTFVASATTCRKRTELELIKLVISFSSYYPFSILEKAILHPTSPKCL